MDTPIFNSYIVKVYNVNKKRNHKASSRSGFVCIAKSVSDVANLVVEHLQSEIPEISLNSFITTADGTCFDYEAISFDVWFSIQNTSGLLRNRLICL